MSCPSEVDVIIAYYNEDLNWLLTTIINGKYKLVEYCIIYCKGPNEPSDEIKDSCKKWKKLENVGRESHTYIHHFIENYENGLTNNIVCLQGSISDHKELIVSGSLDSYINNKDSLFGINSSITGHTLLQPIQHYGIWLEKIKDGRIQKSEFLSTGEWLQNIFDIKINSFQNYPVIYAANFAVNINLLKNISKEVWIKSLNHLNYHDPENGHYQERSWAIVFLKKFLQK